MKKLIESIDAIQEAFYDNDTDREKMNAFRELGLDEHQWEVFSMTWDYRQKEIDDIHEHAAELAAGEDL